MKQLQGHVFVCPAVLHDGVGAIDTGRIAVGRYLNLDPVQGRAADLVQLCFEPLKHLKYFAGHQWWRRESEYKLGRKASVMPSICVAT